MDGRTMMLFCTIQSDEISLYIKALKKAEIYGESLITSKSIFMALHNVYKLKHAMN